MSPRSAGRRPGSRERAAEHEHAPTATPTAADVEAAYKPGTVVQAVVTSIRDELNRGWLELEDAVQSTLVAADVGRHGILRIGSLLSVTEFLWARTGVLRLR